MVVGSGTMGVQIGFPCAGHGFDVVLYDAAASALESAHDRLVGYADALVGDEIISAELRDSAQARITTTSDPSAAAEAADLLSEAIPEDPKLKGQVLGEFNELCPPRTIFMTNTSTLLPSQFAAATGRPDRLLALHFHLPVWINNVADVMPHNGTRREVTELAVAFARRIGQVPIELRHEHNGYVLDAMYTAVNRQAITIGRAGVASIEDIDRAWMGVTQVRRLGLSVRWMRLASIPPGRSPTTGPDGLLSRQLRRNARFLRPTSTAGSWA